MKICIVAHQAHSNALGRSHSHWLVARSLGWCTSVLVPDASEIWPPLRDHDDFTADLTTDEESACVDAEVLVAVKPLPGSFDRALKIGAARGIPVILDIDDPDWENLYGERPSAAVALLIRRALHGKPPPLKGYLRRWQAARAPNVTVSNPGMHRWYKRGIVLPHARVVRPPGKPPSDRQDLHVVFVGTVRPHKGIATLREAVRRVSGATLTVTADPPVDAYPHEAWVGVTDMNRGLDLVDSADVVALVSSDSFLGRGQLPAKLIDAMLAGRAVVASDLPPMRWALSDTGLIVRPDDVAALEEALIALQSPSLRRDLGSRARQRAIDMFSVDAVGAVLSRTVKEVVTTTGPKR